MNGIFHKEKNCMSDYTTLKIMISMGLCLFMLAIVILIPTYMIIGFVKLWRSRGKKTVMKIDHIQNDDKKKEIRDLLKRKGYRLIQNDPQLWKKDIYATKYHIEFREMSGKTKISFWWNNWMFGDHTYPLDLPYWISQHYRLILNYKQIKKIIETGKEK